MTEGPVGQQELTNRVYIGPNKTGDNIDAFKVAPYVYDEKTSQWVRDNGGLIPTGYDAITYTNTSSTIDTYQYYVGGTGGTLVATLTITYSDATTKLIIASVVRT